METLYKEVRQLLTSHPVILHSDDIFLSITIYLSVFQCNCGKVKSPLSTVAQNGLFMHVALPETRCPPLRWYGPGTPTPMDGSNWE